MSIQIRLAYPQLSMNGLFPLRVGKVWRRYIQDRCVTTISCHWSLSEKATTSYVTDVLSHMFTNHRLSTRYKTIFTKRHAHVSLSVVMFCWVGPSPLFIWKRRVKKYFIYFHSNYILLLSFKSDCYCFM